MAALNQTQKRFIVERLACFDTPTEVSEAFQEEYGMPINRQQVHNYNASKDYIRDRMSEELVNLFDASRNQFRENVDGIAIANKSYRLGRLNRIAQSANSMRNYKMEMEALEQAAKEVGEAYTNRQLVDMTSGGERIQGVVFTKPGE